MNSMRAQQSLRAADVRVSNATCQKTKAVHELAGAPLINEFSQLQAKLFHANNLFWTVAWQHTTSSRRGHHPTGDLPY